ncbi:MAG: hypothetical protein GWP91_16350, partial [Rhodobacterales bacterium]|nr:hypothetical protein [Rhodobacterales bacterium]
MHTTQLRTGGTHRLIDGVLDLGQHCVRRGQDTTSLTWLEVLVLDYLISAEGRAVSRGELLTFVWGYAADSRSRAADRTIARIRAKIEAVSRQPKHLISLHGVGYRWAVAIPTVPMVHPTRLESQLAHVCVQHSLVGVVGETTSGRLWVEQALGELADDFRVFPTPRPLHQGDLIETLVRDASTHPGRSVFLVESNKRPDSVGVARLLRGLEQGTRSHVLLLCPQPPIEADTHVIWLPVPTAPAVPTRLPHANEDLAIAIAAQFIGGALQNQLDPLVHRHCGIEYFSERAIQAGWARIQETPAGTRLVIAPPTPTSHEHQSEAEQAYLQWALSLAYGPDPATATSLRDPLESAMQLALRSDLLHSAARLAARIDDLFFRLHLRCLCKEIFERLTPSSPAWRIVVCRTPLPTINVACAQVNLDECALHRWTIEAACAEEDWATAAIAAQRIGGHLIREQGASQGVPWFVQGLEYAKRSQDDIAIFDAAIRLFAVNAATGPNTDVIALDTLHRRAARQRLWGVVASLVSSQALYNANYGDLVLGQSALEDTLPVLERTGLQLVYFTMVVHNTLMRMALGQSDGLLEVLDGHLLEAHHRGSWYGVAFIDAARGALLAQLGEWGLAKWSWEKAK